MYVYVRVYVRVYVYVCACVRAGCHTHTLGVRRSATLAAPQTQTHTLATTFFPLFGLVVEPWKRLTVEAKLRSSG